MGEQPSPNPLTEGGGKKDRSHGKPIATEEASEGGTGDADGDIDQPARVARGFLNERIQPGTRRGRCEFATTYGIGEFTHGMVEALVDPERADVSHASNALAADADSDSERSITDPEVDAFSPETAGYHGDDFLDDASAGAAFHEDSSEFHGEHCNLFEGLAFEGLSFLHQPEDMRCAGFAQIQSGWRVIEKMRSGAPVCRFRAGAHCGESLSNSHPA
jgi:hypothetical protein